jgi:hypothetical protein
VKKLDVVFDVIFCNGKLDFFTGKLKPTRVYSWLFPPEFLTVGWFVLVNPSCPCVQIDLEPQASGSAEAAGASSY